VQLLFDGPMSKGGHKESRGGSEREAVEEQADPEGTARRKHRPQAEPKLPLGHRASSSLIQLHPSL